MPHLLTFMLNTYNTVMHSLILHHLLITSSLNKANFHGVPSRESNSDQTYFKPTHYQLSWAALYLSYAATVKNLHYSRSQKHM
jgi:hypothetical protein